MFIPSRFFRFRARLNAGIFFAAIVGVGLVDGQAARPNIVMIVADDHGTDAMGCYGNPVIKTPNLDALAADGTRFTYAFCTTASCSPSRSVILSGQQNHRNGMYGLEHQDNHFQSFLTVKSLPVMLAASGYRTARIGKYHIAPESVYSFQSVLSDGAANDPATIGRSPVEMAERTRALIEASSEKPFFLYFATDDPHRGNAVLPDGRPTFETYPNPNPFGNRPQGYPGITPVKYDPKDVIVPPFLPDNEMCRKELAEYYQAVSRVDQGVGRLIKILKDAGKYENTLILYLSDNGIAFPGSKTSLYEGGMRLPLLVRAPGRMHPGAIQNAMVSWADLTPTVLDFAEATPAKTEFDGRSFKAGLDGEKLSGWDEVYASHTFHEVTMYYPMRLVRTRQYKLIHNLDSEISFPFALDLAQAPTWLEIRKRGLTQFGRRTVDQYLHRPEYELYDLEKDPDEVVNLAEKPELQKIKNELIAKVESFQKRTFDPWLGHPLKP